MESVWWSIHWDGHEVHNPSQGIAGYLQQYKYEVFNARWEIRCSAHFKAHNKGKVETFLDTVVQRNYNPQKVVLYFMVVLFTFLFCLPFYNMIL